MKIAWRTIAGTGAFIAPFAAIYWFGSYEHSGTALLIATSVALLLLGAYLFLAARHASGLPEDRTDGALPATDEIGVFPSASVWPVVLGLGALFAALGLAYNGWLALPGAVVLLVAIGGMVVESGG